MWLKLDWLNDIDEVSIEEIPYSLKAFKDCEISNYSNETIQLLCHTLWNIWNRVLNIWNIDIDEDRKEQLLRQDGGSYNKIMFFLCWRTVEEVDKILKPMNLMQYEWFTDEKYEEDLLSLIDNYENWNENNDEDKNK